MRCYMSLRTIRTANGTESSSPTAREKLPVTVATAGATATARYRSPSLHPAGDRSAHTVCFPAVSGVPSFRDKIVCDRDAAMTPPPKNRARGQDRVDGTPVDHQLSSLNVLFRRENSQFRVNSCERTGRAGEFCRGHFADAKSRPHGERILLGV